MAVFIECETDPFDAELQRQREQIQAGRVDDLAVRRPLRGLQVKENTYSYIRVVDKFGNVFPLEDSSAVANMPLSFAYANYLVTQMSVTRAERYQVVPTFSETYIFLFGEQPVQININGCFVESADFTWSAEFWRNYDEYLRGTRLADRQARMYLYIDGMLIEGLCLGFNNVKSSDQPHLVPFNLTVLATNVTMLTQTAFQFPVRGQQIQFLEVVNQPSEALGEVGSDLTGANQQAATSFSARQVQMARAAYAQNRSRSLAEQKGALFRAAGTEPGSPLVYQGEANQDALYRLDAQASTTDSSPVPLRGNIQDNLDEYLVRPTQTTIFIQRREEETDTGEGSQIAHYPIDLYPEHHVYDYSRDMWVYVPPPPGHPIDFTDTYDSPAREDEVARVHGLYHQPGDPTVGQMVGYSDPAAEPAFGSGTQQGSLQ